jgi:Condensation domain
MPNQPGEIGTAQRGVAPRSRKLAGLEHAMRITEEHIPFSVVAVLRLDGTLSPAVLRGALDTLQQRHPLLGARIVAAGSEYEFHFDAPNSIPLDVSERPPSDGWVAVAQEEMHRRLDMTAGPLARCRYLAGPGGGDLIFTLHHTIVDGPSGVELFRELLALCAGRTPEEPPDAREGQVSAPAIFPDECAGLGYSLAAAAYMRRQMADEMAFRWGSMGVRKAPIAETGRCCFLPIRFGRELSNALIQASRRHRVTLNSILSAGMLTAVQRHLYPSPRVPLRHIVFADLRPRLREEVPASALGCFLTMYRFTATVERAGEFWPFAAAVQDATMRAARSSDRYMANAMAPGMMKMLFRLKAFRMGATALSYTGPLGLPTDYGRFQVTGLHAFAGNMTLGPEYSALVRLFRGELWWDILYLDSDMDAAGARRIADEMQAILQGATS